MAAQRGLGEPEFESVEALLSNARDNLSRVTVEQALELGDAGWGMVDIRPAWQRAIEGEIPGSLIVERNHLEWRLHPSSESRLSIADEITCWIVFCSEGYTSSLAAVSLLSLGIRATDLIGGFHAWRELGHPVLMGVTVIDSIVAAGRQSAVPADLAVLGRSALQPNPRLHPALESN